VKRHIIRVDAEDFIGWCCSFCPWEMTAPRLDSTAGALALNRCRASNLRESTTAQPARQVSSHCSRQYW